MIIDDLSVECFHCGSPDIDVTIYGGVWQDTKCRSCGMILKPNDTHTGLLGFVCTDPEKEVKVTVECRENQ